MIGFITSFTMFVEPPIIRWLISTHRTHSLHNQSLRHHIYIYIGTLPGCRDSKLRLQHGEHMFGFVVIKTVANQGETARALNECALATSLIPFVTPLLLLVSSSRSKNRAYPSMIPVLIWRC